ncbi:unnamed protein product [Protopolystoma xenopodis]|uniref:Uncharacterized protein n=1 Tax=Protopolystoma xenopodis TaxID=117903 RepID=A0A3S5CHC4_9PLAT|nr:unnamed protein product [Protopolystoma xenopodis]
MDKIGSFTDDPFRPIVGGPSKRGGIVDLSRISVLYAGGHPMLPLLVEHDKPLFVATNATLSGCIQNLHINGRLLDPRRTALLGSAIDGYGIGKADWYGLI